MDESAEERLDAFTIFTVHTLNAETSDHDLMAAFVCKVHLLSLLSAVVREQNRSVAQYVLRRVQSHRLVLSSHVISLIADVRQK